MSTCPNLALKRPRCMMIVRRSVRGYNLALILTDTIAAI